MGFTSDSKEVSIGKALKESFQINDALHVSDRGSQDGILLLQSCERSRKHEGSSGYKLETGACYSVASTTIKVLHVADSESVRLQFATKQANEEMKMLEVGVGITLTKIGKAQDCDVLIEDENFSDWHLSVVFEEGKFFLIERDTSHPHRVWRQLRLTHPSTEPHSASSARLASGDIIRTSAHRFRVNLRRAPGAPIGRPKAAAQCAKAIAACLEPNFSRQKEMQDRVAVIDGFAGLSNGFFAVFDGHSDRHVADFLSAVLHQNVLEAIGEERHRCASACTTTAGASQPDATIDAASALATLPSRHASSSLPLLVVDTQLQQNHTRALANSLQNMSLEENTHSRSAPSINVPSELTSRSVDSSPVLAPAKAPAASFTERSGGVKFAVEGEERAATAAFDMKRVLRRAYQRTAKEVAALGDTSRFSGSTAVSSVLWRDISTCKQRIYTANVGDSKAVLCRATRAESLSFDHNARDESEQARVQRVGGKIGKGGRLASCLDVTRGFGDLALSHHGLIAEPSISEVEVEPTDSYLVLASDGLWDFLSNEELFKITKEAKKKNVPASALARTLVNISISRNTRDNISVVVVELSHSSESPSPRTDDSPLDKSVLLPPAAPSPQRAPPVVRSVSE